MLWAACGVPAGSRNPISNTFHMLQRSARHKDVAYNTALKSNDCNKVKRLDRHIAQITCIIYYSFTRLLWHIFPITVYFFKTAHTQPITEDEITKTLFDVCRMT